MLCVSLNNQFCLFICLILCQWKKRTHNCKVPETLFKFKHFWNRNIWQLYPLQPMKKLSLLVALFLMVSMFCSAVIKEVIMKMEKTLFVCYSLISLLKQNIFPSFPKVSWVLSALQNDEWMPSLFIIIAQVILIYASNSRIMFQLFLRDENTFLLMNKHCHFLNICMQNVFKATMKCFARALGNCFSKGTFFLYLFFPAKQSSWKAFQS